MALFAQASDIKCGCIGYGGAFNMGRSHLNQMKDAGMTPTAVCEIDPERLKVAGEEFPGIELYSSVDELLEKSDVNMLAIITPHNSHAEISTKCCAAGKHICCEKPLAITTEECDQILAAAKANNVVASTYHNRHWDGCILRAVDEIVNKGVIGDVFRIEAHMGGYSKPRDWWRASKSISGGILFDWGVHLLEYSLQLIKSDIKEVTGFAHNGYWRDQTVWKEDGNEDEGFGIVRFSGGEWLTLRISQLESNPKDGQLEIYGTKGCYVMSGGSYEVITVTEEGQTITTKGKNPPSEGGKYYQNVADHLTKDEELIITTEWARRPIHILDLADKSAKQGEAMKATYA
jgi:scyllo-inositol 2-dehydrogenase (NADP+)